MALTLVGTIEGKAVRQIIGEGELLLGRGVDADLRLPLAGVSRRHAVITCHEGRAVVKDMGSRNGTQVNGETITDEIPLRAGDVIDIAGQVFRVLPPEPADLTCFNESATLMPHEEISWEEVRNQREQKRDRQSFLFQVLAEAGALLTIQRAPEELYEPILDLVETALAPERSFILLLESGSAEPVIKASRLKGDRRGDTLALSRTMVQKVLQQRTSFLTTDPLNDPNLDGAMSMVVQSIRTAVAAPLFDNEDVIGLLYADDSRAGKRITRDELQAFTYLANGIAVAISHARYHVMEEEKRRQDAELRTANNILRHILPTSLPDCPGYELGANLESCYEVGGDLYDARMLPDGRLAFVLADVAGKGIGAALLVTQILSLARFMVGESWEPGPVAERLNREIFKTTDYSRFATAFFGFLDPATGRMTCVNAGHNPPVLVRADGRVENCTIGGLPVGVLEDSTYPTAEVVLEPGDTLAVCSDGIPDTENEADEEYGDDRFAALLRHQRRDPLDQVIASVYTDLAEFRGEAPVIDDATLLLLRRKPLRYDTGF